jgi:magnesium chelatase family protein
VIAVLARTHSAGALGIDGYVVTVESDIGPGLPGLTIVGQVNGPMYDAGLRVRAALDCCGFSLPRCKQIVNLAPAEQRKDSTGVDLAIACALLVSHGVIPAESLTGVMLWGELAPDGSLRPPVGTLIAAETARRHGFRVLALPAVSAQEAALIAGLDLLLVPDLHQLIAHLRSKATLYCGPVRDVAPDTIHESANNPGGIHDPLVQLALEVMIAGGHHILIHGPHAPGKTTLARQVAGLLDVVDDADALELAKLHATHSRTGLIRVPQVRMANPTVSAAKLLGGGMPPRPGEVSLAHHGVLVLDELPKFSGDCLQGIRFAMEDDAVTILGVRFPARFRLLATARRWPCARHLSPLLDRVDLIVPLPSDPRTTMAPESHANVRRRLTLARLRQRERLAGTPWRSNAEIPTSGNTLNQLLPCTPAVGSLLEDQGLDLREARRTCRIAGTIADLDPTRDPAAPIDVDVIALARQLRELPQFGYSGILALQVHSRLGQQRGKR